MHFGVFGTWGTYVFSILILYSPDGKSNDARTNGRYCYNELIKIKKTHLS